MSPALARIKRAVRGAVALAGGIDGAGATAGRCRSVAGDWNNLNSGIFPPLDCGFALDEVALAQGHTPPIVSALARELGGVFVALPEANGAEHGIAAALLEIMDEVGQLASGVRTSLGDGVCDRAEAAALRALLGVLITRASIFDRQLAAIERFDASTGLGRSMSGRD